MTIQNKIFAAATALTLFAQRVMAQGRNPDPYNRHGIPPCNETKDGTTDCYGSLWILPVGALSLLTVCTAGSCIAYKCGLFGKNSGTSGNELATPSEGSALTIETAGV